MRIACPACAATYEVPAGLLAAGQRVSCARCGKDWTPLAAADASASDIAIPAVPPVSEPTRPPPARPPSAGPPSAGPAQPLGVAPPERPPSRVAPPEQPPAIELTRPDWFPRVATDRAASEARLPLVPLAWIGSVAILLALLGAGVATRDSLMAQWPPTSRLFAALGLDDR